MAKWSCFVIGPKGQENQNLNRDVLDYIIYPALEPYDFHIFSEDRQEEINQYDKYIEDSTLCIFDLTRLDPTVLYALGVRSSSRKPMLVFKAKDQEIPFGMRNVDIIDYDFTSVSSFRTIDEIKKKIRDYVDPLEKTGFKEENSRASLDALATTLQQIERKLDRLTKEPPKQSSLSSPAPSMPLELGNSDPRILFALALKQRDLEKIDQLLDVLYRQNKLYDFIDLYAEAAAARGSEKAGAMLLEYAQEFIDSDMSLKKKYEFIGSLVSYLNRKDLEDDNQEFVEELIDELFAYMEVHPDEDPEHRFRAGLYNQLNRLYNGIYQNGDNIEFLEKAYNNIQKALSYCDNDKSYLYNCASLQYSFFQTARDDRPQVADDYLAKAAVSIDKCLLNCGDDYDEDYLLKAYRIHKAREDDTRVKEVLEIMKIHFPQTAQMISMFGDDFF